MRSTCRFFLCFTGAALTALAQAPRTETFSILLAGNPAGKSAQTTKTDGTIEIQYSYNDRGRGPEVKGRYQFDTLGFPTLVDLGGIDYYKAPVDEHLKVADNEARWKSTSEQGEAGGPAFYVSINGPPVEIGWLINTLQKSPHHFVQLLPGGEAHLEEGPKTTLRRAGQALAVTEFLVTGLDFVPTPVWLDANNHFFAVAGPWFAVVREGWESANDELLKLQDAAQDARYRALAQRLSRHPKAIVIRNVRLFDSAAATMKEGQTVRIAGDRIQSVESNANFTPGPEIELIDGSGQTLLPGLWDMHAHIQPSYGLLNIASGVTSVRDLANDMDMLLRLRKQYDSGETIGPRIFMAGFIDGRGPYQGPTKVFADTEAEARAAIDKYASLGYQQIKVYSSLKPELLPKIAAMAHSKGMRLSGHVPNGMTAEQFIRAGADEVQHMNFVFLNFMADKASDTRTPARFTVVGENAASLNQNSPEVADFIRLLQERKTVLDPTMGAFESLFLARPGRIAPGWEPVASRLPAQVQRQTMIGGLPAPSEKDRLYRESYTALERMLKRLYDAGIPLVAGTDDVEGLMLHRELELWVKAGIPAAKVLQIATLGAAKVAQADGDVGSIEPGKKADLVLVQGNPIANIADVRHPTVVIKNGVEYRSAQLYEALGIKP
jgi:imidazolonepropionase-like amidohydrolase